MKADKLELMEKWDTVVSLMGLDQESIYDDYYAQDDVSFYDLLREHELHLERMANPSEMMKMVLRTHEMNITTDDIDDYMTHKDQIREHLLEEERQRRISTNPAIIELREVYNLKTVEPKRYKNHHHFEFTDPTGIVVSGRMFMLSWHSMRVWLEWKPSKGGKRVRFKWDTAYSNIQLPKTFPNEWNDYGYAKNHDQRMHVIAHNVIHRKMPKLAKFKYPV